jgi:hypothetical protein
VRRFIVGLGLAAVLSGTAASGAWADNPPGTGQPGANGGNTCGQNGLTTQPPGLLKPGFLNVASQHYAGSPLNPNASGNPKAVSEYDVACFQLSSH